MTRQTRDEYLKDITKKKNDKKIQIETYYDFWEKDLMIFKEISTIIGCATQLISVVAEENNWFERKKQYLCNIKEQIKTPKQEIEPIKPYKETNQFKEKVEYQPIEWSDKVAPEIKIENKVKKEKFDPLKYAKKLMQEAEKNSISAKGKKCQRCGMFLPAFGEKNHECRKNR